MFGNQKGSVFPEQVTGGAEGTHCFRARESGEELLLLLLLPRCVGGRPELCPSGTGCSAALLLQGDYYHGSVRLQHHGPTATRTSRDSRQMLSAGEQALGGD